MVSVVRISTLVNGSPLNVYKVLKRIERFPEFMPQIKKIKILRRLPSNRQISEWEVEIEGTLIRWKEEEAYDDESQSLSFRMTEGDYKVFEGRWTIAEARASKTRVSVEAMFDWGLPSLGRYVGPVLEKKAKKNLMRMVAALRRNMRTGSLLIHG